MIKFTDAALRRGTSLLFEDVDFAIFPQQKVGFVGKNGCGKSSSFQIFLGNLSLDAGHCEIPKSWVIAHMQQETPGLSISAIHQVLDGDREFREIEEKLKTAEEKKDGLAIAALHERFHLIDGYTAHARAAQLLHGLGFHHNDFERPVSSFSGGWRVRLNLAQALMCRSDLLLLDEPTNHLDLDAIVWLESYLKNYVGTLLLISHDRDFLNNVCSDILQFENQGITLYKGNYDAFERLRGEKLALQAAMHAKQEKARAHMQSFVDRFRAKASKAKQAQSRLKALSKLEQISAVQVDGSFNFQFKEPLANPNPLIDLDRVSVGYDDKTILSDLSFSLSPGRRIGVLGPNGAGKSTFIKLLAGELSPKQGNCTSHTKLKVGYFAQHQVDYLDLQASPLLHMQRLDPKISEQEARNHLGRFAFPNDKALSTIETFSGGERARLALALIVWERPNLLLLDEPTNHLDMTVRDTLTLALQDFAGSMLIVSHDRHLLRMTTDELLLVNGGKVEEFNGDLNEYQRVLLDLKAGKKTKKSSLNPKEQRELSKKRKSLDNTLANTHKKLSEIEKTLSDPNLYKPGQEDTLKALHDEERKMKKKAKDVESEWLIVCEKMEG